MWIGKIFPSTETLSGKRTDTDEGSNAKFTNFKLYPIEINFNQKWKLQMENKLNRHETEDKINAYAWKDPAFKKKFLDNPHAALREMGMKNIPADIKIDIIKEEKKHWCVVLREPPAGYESLSVDELLKLRAAYPSWDPRWGSCNY